MPQNIRITGMLHLTGSLFTDMVVHFLLATYINTSEGPYYKGPLSPLELITEHKIKK